MAVPEDQLPSRAGRAPPNHAPPSEWTLPAVTASIPWARHLAAGWLAAAGAPEPETQDVQLVLSELVTNAVLASRGAEGDIRVELTAEPVGWGIAVSDCGGGFVAPDAPAAPDPLSVGGRGLHVVAEVAGPLSVQRDDGWTVVRTMVASAPAGDPRITRAGSGRSGR
jgi:anti-sigma regulatory factor (Ser/Thr protein kinase)